MPETTPTTTNLRELLPAIATYAFVFIVLGAAIAAYFTGRITDPDQFFRIVFELGALIGFYKAKHPESPDA